MYLSYAFPAKSTIKCFPEVTKGHIQEDWCLPFDTLLKGVSEYECLFHCSPSLSEASLVLVQPLIYTLFDSVDKNYTEDLQWH